MIFRKFNFIFFVLAGVIYASELITPLPQDFKYDKEKAALGKILYHDSRLSGDNTISCASCHILNEGGDDNIALAVGIDGKVGTRNSPTVLNSRYNFKQFWDGRAKDLQEQAEGPVLNPIEMNSSFKEVIRKLSQDQQYKEIFNKIYSDGITTMNITDAIAEFEKALVTPNARFDQYLRGDKNALNTTEKEGYELFQSYGCISCHNGVNIGGNLFQKIGVVKNFTVSAHEFGRYAVTKNEQDKFVFKVPSLRNIDLTAPYFHDGSVKSLKEAVTIMLDHQVGIALDEKDIDKIVAFLKTLTGETPLIMKEVN